MTSSTRGWEGLPLLRPSSTRCSRKSNGYPGTFSRVVGLPPTARVQRAPSECARCASTGGRPATLIVRAPGAQGQTLPAPSFPSVLGDDLLSNLLGDRFVSIKLHAVCGAPLRTRAQVRRIAKHLAQWNRCFNGLRASPHLDTLNLAAPRVEVADDIPMYSCGTKTSTFIIGSSRTGSAFL